MHYYKFGQSHHNFIWTFGQVVSFRTSTVNLLGCVLSVAISLIISKWNSMALYFSNPHPMVSYLTTLHNEQLTFCRPQIPPDFILTLRLCVPHYSRCLLSKPPGFLQILEMSSSVLPFFLYMLFSLPKCTSTQHLITSNLLLMLWLLSGYNSIPKRRTFKLGQCWNTTVWSRDSFTFLFLVTVPSKAYSEDLNL